MKNRVQNILIILLSLSAATFLFLTLSGGMGLFGLYRPDAGNGSDAPAAAPIQPVAAVVNDGSACLRLTAPHLLTPYFDQLRPVLVELLGSAVAPVSADAEAWAGALLGKGVLLDYGALLPMDVVAGGMGGALAAYPADSLLIVLEGEFASVMLYADGSGCFAAQTALKTADLGGLLAPGGGDPAVYACALPESAASLTPHSAVPEDMELASVLTCEPLCGEGGSYDRDRQALILAAFGFDVYTARSYIDSQGSRVFLAEHGSLRMSGDGTVAFAAGEAEGLATGGAQGLSAYAGFAANILQSCMTGLSGQPRYCVSFAGEQDGVVTVEFDALARGLPLVAANGSRTAASFVFENGRLILAEAALFAVSAAEAEAALPPLPVEALLSGMNGSAPAGRLTPAYVQAEDGLWRLSWCVLPVERHMGGQDE